MPSDEATVARIRLDFRRIAVIGISARPDRDSHRVAGHRALARWVAHSRDSS